MNAGTDAYFFPERCQSVSPSEGVIAQNSDDELATRSASGDDEAFRRLVERHQMRIYRFCCQWLSDEDDAREAAQDTFVKAYAALGAYRPRGRFTAWIYRIALNQCRDRHRSRESRQRRETTRLPEAGAPGEPLCSCPSPDEIAAQVGEWERIQRGIESLPLNLREVLVLRGVEGLDGETCARILRISSRAVEGRYYRSKKALAAWLESQ